MSEKRERDSASLTNEEARKQRKLDKSLSSGSDSNAKQGDGSENAIRDSPASAIVHNVDSLSPLMENKLRIQDDADSSSGSVPASFHDQDSPTKKMCSSSSSSTASASASASCSSKDQQPSGSNQRTLLYKNSLTHDDVFYSRLMIPVQSCREFQAEPEIVGESITMIIMDQDGEMWLMVASLDEMSNSYMLWYNWDAYVKKYELEPEDVIFIYEDPDVPTYDHYLIECEKKMSDSSPIETT